MTIEAIISFVSLCRCGSFQRAANELHITQPTLTARIKNLETDVEAKLFFRNRNGAVLTESGKIFMPYAFRIYDNYIRAIDSLHKDANFLTVGSSCPASLTSSLLEYLKKKSDQPISLKIGSTASMVSQLLTGEISFAFTQKIKDPKITQVLLLQDSVSLYASKNHRLNDLQHQITLEELSIEPLIVYSKESAFWEELRAHFQKRELNFCQTVEIDSFSATTAMLLNGNYVAFLPDFSMLEETRAGMFYRIGIFPSLNLTWSVYLSHRTDISADYLKHINSLLSQFPKIL